MNTHKILKVTLVDPMFDPSTSVASGQGPRLYEFECLNILKKFEHREVSCDDIADALDVLIAELCLNDLHEIVVDISDRDKSLAPAKEMTIEEIEKELGHKVKIVGVKKKGE